MTEQTVVMYAGRWYSLRLTRDGSSTYWKGNKAVHASLDNRISLCGHEIGPKNTMQAYYDDRWQEVVNCYNCCYRASLAGIWTRQKIKTAGGTTYVRPPKQESYYSLPGRH